MFPINGKINKGFTLIELLVVVAIIGVLATIVLASLNSARTKAKDAAIKSEVRQAINLLSLNYNDYQSYAQIQVDGSHPMHNASECNDAAMSGTYANQMKAICINVVSLIPSSSSFWVGGLSGSLDGSTFSVMVNTLNNGKFYCVGSSGGISETADNYWTPPYSAGCVYNP